MEREVDERVLEGLVRRDEFRDRALLEDATIIHDDTIVHEALEILDDMRGEEDRFLAFLAEIAKVLDEEPPVSRIQAEREIIEDEQFGILRHEQTECHLGALSVGHLAKELVVLDLEQPHQFVVRLFVPFGEERCIEALYLGDGHEGVLHMSLEQQTDTRPLTGRHGTRVIAKQPASAGIGFEYVHAAQRKSIADCLKPFG